MNLRLKSVIALALTSIMALSSLHISALSANTHGQLETDLTASEMQIDPHYVRGDVGQHFNMNECLESIASTSSSMLEPTRITLQAHDEIRIYTAEQLAGKTYSWTTVQGSGSPDRATISTRSDGMYIVGLHPETEFLQVTIGSTTEYFFVTIYLADSVYSIDNYTTHLRLKDTNEFYEGKKAQHFETTNSSVLYKDELFKIIHYGVNSYCIRSMLNSSMALCADGDDVVFKTIGTSNDSIPNEAIWTITVSDLNYGKFNVAKGTDTISSSRDATDGSEVKITTFISSEDCQSWDIVEYEIPYGTHSNYTGVVIPNSISRLGVGEKYKLTADIYSYQPNENGQNGFTWSVTNGTGSATISTDGTLTGVSKGTVTVTATYNSTSYSTSITINITDPMIEDGVYYMRNTVSSKTIAGSESSNTTWATDINSTDEQKWLIELNSNGYYTIRSSDGANYLCFGSPDYGDPLIYWDAYVPTYADWCIVFTDNEYRLIPSILTESGARIYITTDNQVKITWDNSKHDQRGLWTFTAVS